MGDFQAVPFGIDDVFNGSQACSMVSSPEEGPERLIADVKIFNPQKDKSAQYVIQGFRQVYQYVADLQPCHRLPFDIQYE